MPTDPDDIRSQVQDLARLSCLAVAPDKVAAVGQDLADVLALVESLGEAPVHGIEPMAHPLSSGLRLRDDVVRQELSREALQAPAPEVEDGYFLVPRVIE